MDLTGRVDESFWLVFCSNRVMSAPVGRLYFMGGGQTDEDIVRRVVEGDGESFGLLVGRYEEKLARYAKKFLIGREDSQDILQEIFIKAYRNIQSFDAARRFSPWIYRIAHNEFVNAGKKRWKEKIFSFDFDVVFPHPIAREAADAGAEGREARQMLDVCMDRLDAKYREPLVLYYFEGLDYREIADIMRIPLSSVGVRMARGRERLKKIFTEQYGKLV